MVRYKELIHRQLFSGWGAGKRLLIERPSSFPFISGDTIRAMADRIVSGDASVTVVGDRPGLVYVEVPRAGQLMTSLMDIESDPHPDSCLVVHDGDVIPDPGLYAHAVRAFARVFSVNATAEHLQVGVHPLPIGIENLALDRVGRLTRFPRPYTFAGTLSGAPRPVRITASFRLHTNPPVRGPLREALRNTDVTWIEPSGDDDRYFAAVRQSTFVLSPPGNGPDCHRTWEAVYLGAVPVVLASAMPAELAADLPILRVESYEEFLGLSWEEKLGLIEPMRGMRSAKAYMPFWCRELLGGHADY